MRQELLQWIDNCFQKLLVAVGDDEDALLLVNAFISQYDIQALKILDQSAFQSQVQRLRKIFIALKNNLRDSNLLRVDSDLLDDRKRKLDILFWPVQKMHIDMVEDIYNRLRMERDLAVGILTHNEAINRILVERNFENQIDFSNSGQHLYSYRNLLTEKILKKARQLPSFRVRSRHLSFRELLERCWRAWYWYFDYTIRVYREVKRKYSPEIIFVGNDLTLVGNTVSQLAHRDNIIISSIMHGTIKSPFWKYSHADYFYLFGDKDKKLMLDRGKQEKGLIVSGSPRMQGRINKGRRNAIPFHNYLLVALSGPGHSVTLAHHKAILRLLLLATKSYPSLEFIFKLHKKDDERFYEKLKICPNAYIINYEDPLNQVDIGEWLHPSRALITGASMTAMDAMMINKPVVTIDLVDDFKEVDFIRDGVTLHVRNKAELDLALNAIMEENKNYDLHLEHSKTFSQKAFASVEGGTAKFVADHLKQLLVEA